MGDTAHAVWVTRLSQQEREGRLVRRSGLEEVGVGLFPIVWYLPEYRGFYMAGVGVQKGFGS